MGFVGMIFGGGTTLAVSLNSTNVIAGGVVAGKVTVSGGSRPLTMTSVIVTAHAGGREVGAQTVGVGVALPPGKHVPFEFHVALPPETIDMTGNAKITARADIPGVKDPTSDATFTIIAPGQKRSNADEKDLLARYPGLTDSDESEQFSALCELRSEAYGPKAEKLVGLASWLLQFAKTGPVDLRDEALETWAALLNNRARSSDIEELEAFAADPSLKGDLRRAVVTAATKFADEGAAPLLAKLAKDPDAEVREAVVRSVHFDADDHFAGRLELISALATDTSEKVRHSVAAALAQFADNEGAMKLAVEMSANDASPKVRAEALESLALAHYGGMLELVLDAYMQAAKSPSDDVRKAIAGRVSTLPADPRVAEIVGALLADANVEVRKKMAWYGVNMADHPTLKPLFERVAESDPDESVRAEAVSGMRGFYKPTAAIAYARQRLAADPTEKLAWTCVNIARSLDDERDARFLLEDVAKCKHEAAAASAQEALRDL